MPHVISFWSSKISAHLSILLSLLLGACGGEKPLNVAKTPAPKTNKIEKYIYQHFTKPYRVKVRYTYSFTRNPPYAVPIHRNYVLPYLQFLENYWIAAFLNIPRGKAYIEKYAPTEIHLQGEVYRKIQSVYKGAEYAEYHAQAQGGYVVRLNSINRTTPSLKNSLTRHSELKTVFHEHAHIHHMLFDFPAGWGKLSPYGHSKQDVAEHIQVGMVSKYAATSEAEDFAETFAYYIVDPNAVKRLLVKKNCSTVSGNDIPKGKIPWYDTSLTTYRLICHNGNRGRDAVQKKINAVKAHYLEFGGIDLDTLQKTVQKLLAAKP